MNEGTGASNVAAGAEYRPQLLRRAVTARYRAPIARSLESADRRTSSRARAHAEPGGTAATGWQRVNAVLTRDRDRSARPARARDSTAPAAVWLDMVSLFPAKTFKDRAERAAAGPRAGHRRHEARLHPRPGRLFRRRHHDREPATVEAIARTDRRTARARTARGATGARTASAITSSCSSPRTSAPTRSGSSTSACRVRSAAARSCQTPNCRR